jgi:hypothetical protein
VNEHKTALTLGNIEITRELRAAQVTPSNTLPNARLAPNLQLVGYDLDRDSVSPGENLTLALYWRARGAIAQNYTIAVQLLNRDGKAIASHQDSTVRTSEWRAGELWREWHDVQLPPDVAAGKFLLTVQLLTSDGSTASGMMLGAINIQSATHLFEIPGIQHRTMLRVGDSFELLGYELAPERVKTANTLHLTLYWRALAPSKISYTVFTHLLDANSRVVAQKDSIPAESARPTTGWVNGEIIVDEYEIALNANTSPGQYALEVGMYDAASGSRLSISDQNGKLIGDHVLLDTRVVVQ